MGILREAFNLLFILIVILNLIDLKVSPSVKNPALYENDVIIYIEDVVDPKSSLG